MPAYQPKCHGPFGGTAFSGATSPVPNCVVLIVSTWSLSEKGSDPFEAFHFVSFLTASPERVRLLSGYALRLRFSGRMKIVPQPYLQSAWPVTDHLATRLNDRDDEKARDEGFVADVISGLSGRRKHLESKHLYDERGSALFDQICQLPEYYPARTEQAIMRTNAEEIVREIGPNATLVELGSGSSRKTKILLDHLESPSAYVPIDISQDHVLATAMRLRGEYPAIKIEPIVEDFCETLRHSDRFTGERVCVYFPGSTIGNFGRTAATRLLRRIGDWCGEEGGLLIGFDLQKDVSILEAAYNDAQGITAAFSLNLLDRMNREASANFDVEQFQHVGLYDESAERIEIYIESLRDQFVQIGDHSVFFASGERIHTEYSHKYTVAGFTAMAEQSGLARKHVWMDDREYFAVMYLERCNVD